MTPIRRLAASILAACCAAEGVAAKAPTTAEALRARIAAVRESLGSLENQRDSVDAELAEIERLYGETARTLGRWQQEAETQEQRLQTIRRQRERLQTEVQNHREALANQLRTAYTASHQGLLKLLLDQDDPEHTARALAYHDYLNRVRLRELRAIQEEASALGTIEEELLEGYDLLNRLQERKQSERDKLADIRESRRQILARLDADVREQARQLAADEQALSRLVSSVQQAAREFPIERYSGVAFRELRGRLPWPTRGKVVRRFGDRRAGGRWDSIVIGAAEGSAVRAVGAGRVVFADWMPGYGFLCIVDHGEGYFTLYGFNQSLHKQVGDPVAAGDVLATVGNSGGQRRAGLYFGVREYAKPIDPLNWLAS